MKVIELTPEQQTAFMEKAQTIYPEFAKGKVAELLEKVQAELKK